MIMIIISVKPNKLKPVMQIVNRELAWYRVPGLHTLYSEEVETLYVTSSTNNANDAMESIKSRLETKGVECTIEVREDVKQKSVAGAKPVKTN